MGCHEADWSTALTSGRVDMDWFVEDMTERARAGLPVEEVALLGVMIDAGVKVIFAIVSVSRRDRGVVFGKKNWV